MGFVWGTRSKRNLSTCHPDIVRVLDRALSYGEIDMAVFAGFRGEQEQNQAVIDGYSTKVWPHSWHNKKPSEAADVGPFIRGKEWTDYVINHIDEESERKRLLKHKGGIPWNDEKYWYKLHAYIMRAAREENVELHWGGFWHKPKDMPHYQRKV